MKTSVKLSRALPKHIFATASILFIALLVTGCATTTPAPVTDRTARPGGQTLPPPVASAPAPIYDRTAPSATTTGTSGAPLIISVTPTSPGAPIAPGVPLSAPSGNTPGSQFHVVQKGENLYRIALNNGIDLNNFAAWNGITPVTPIREGQVLRLRPLDPNAPTVTSGAAGSTMPRAIEGQPLPAPSLSVQPGSPASAPGATSALPVPSVTPIDVPVRRDPVAQRQPYSDSALAQMQREAAGSSAASAAGGVTAASGSASAAGAAVAATGASPLVAPRHRFVPAQALIAKARCGRGQHPVALPANSTNGPR
jgi:LysM repeat protein